MRFTCLVPIVIIACILSLQSCSNAEIGNSKDVNPDAVFLDYRVTGYDDEEDITIVLQFKYAGPFGTTLVLESPSQVSFDDQVLHVDSSRFSGAYYELRVPASSFAGTHRIVYTDANGKQYEDSFEFPVFKAVDSLPTRIQRTDYEFALAGFPENDSVHLVLTDTTFSSPGVDTFLLVEEGKVKLDGAQLAGLKKGPVHLELIWDKEQTLSQTPREGGKILLSYTFRHRFELND